MKSKNTICLWFNRDAHEAARFYAATFPDSTVTAIHKAPVHFRQCTRGPEALHLGRKRPHLQHVCCRAYQLLQSHLKHRFIERFRALHVVNIDFKPNYRITLHEKSSLGTEHLLLLYASYAREGQSLPYVTGCSVHERDGGGVAPQRSESPSPGILVGGLPALGSCDTISDHPVNVVRHSGPLDMKFEITA
jgi:3-demethylubiquinone-9 3-methyltransferase